MTPAQRLKELCLFSLEMTEWRHDNCLQIFKGCCKEEKKKLFSMSFGTRTRNNGLKKHQRQFGYTIKESFLTVGEDKPWTRLCREVEDFYL